MRITIVTISFNQVNFLRQCIDSILSQTECDLEYIVVDPGSTDGSRELIASYTERIIRVFESDKGPADGLNRGFARATGEIFGFINSDDYLLPNALSAVDQHFTVSGIDHFISGSGFIECLNKTPRHIRPTRMTKMGYIYEVCTIFQQGTFFPAWMFREAGGFNISNHTCWDGELFANFLFRGHRHRLLDHNLAVFRIHEASISGSKKLSNAYFCDKKRIFVEKIGRQRNLFDRGFIWLLKGAKVIKFLFRQD